MKEVLAMMYGCGYPVCMPNSNDNSGFGSGWVWAIIIVIFQSSSAQEIKATAVVNTKKSTKMCFLFGKFYHKSDNPLNYFINQINSKRES